MNSFILVMGFARDAVARDWPVSSARWLDCSRRRKTCGLHVTT
jgi:hypothetical protein